MTTEDPTVHPEAGQPPFRTGPWKWREPSHGEHFRTCSFCGSISPDDLAAEPEWRAEWADRKYGWPHKFYVDVPNRRPDDPFVIGATSRMSEDDQRRAYVPTELLSDEQRALAERDGWTPDSYQGGGFMFGPRPMHHAKFYSVHLSDSAVTDAVRATIAERSGLEFTFTPDGRVAWRQFAQATS
jgi:hypothetical protein